MTIPCAPFKSVRLKITLARFEISITPHRDGERSPRTEVLDVPIPYLKVTRGSNGHDRQYPLDRYFPRTPSDPDEINVTYVAASGLTDEQAVKYWDAVTLTSAEEEVTSALRLIAPDVERLNFTSTPELPRNRAPIVKLRGQNTPIPLQNMGEGLNRMLGIALALAHARGGLALIDEFESGLHYSVLTDLWRLVFRLAKQLDIQVWATTHSWDCIQAFQRAAVADPDEEGMLFSLRVSQRDPGVVVAVPFSEEELSVATERDIEVR